MRKRNYVMKQISTVCCESPRNRGGLRRCESPIATPGRNGLQESRCAGRSISPKWTWIFLTLIPQALPAKWVWDSPVGRILDKVGQNWPKLAKIGHGWPNLDKAGQIWTAGGQLFPSVVCRWEQPEECQAKTPALFLAGLRGSGNDRVLHSANETSKKRRQNPALSKCMLAPLARGQARVHNSASGTMTPAHLGLACSRSASQSVVPSMKKHDDEWRQQEDHHVVAGLRKVGIEVAISTDNTRRTHAYSSGNILGPGPWVNLVAQRNFRRGAG